MRVVQDFVFGAFYLVSGIYSLGFCLMLVYTTQPISGNPAVYTVRDAIFPFEVALFAAFGAVFVAASAYHIVRSLRTFGISSLSSSS